MSSDIVKSTGFKYENFTKDPVFWAKRLYSEDKERVIKKLNELRSGQISSMDVAYRWLHKDGKYHWFRDHAVLLRDKKNKPAEILGSWVNISVLTDANKIIEENEEQYKKIVELSPDALFVHSDGVFRFLNSAAIALYGGKKPEDLIGKPVINFFHPDYYEQLRQRMKATFEEKRNLPFIEYKIVTLTGEVKSVEIASTPFTYQGKPAAQGVIIDITKHKEKEELLRSQKETLAIKVKLEEEKLKTEFVADTIHEVRTPLAIIRGNADLALRTGKSGKLKSPKSALQAINHEVEHLSHLLGDLTMLTSPQVGVERMILAHEVDLSKLLRDTVKRAKVLAHQEDVSLQFTPIPPLFVRGDKIYLQKLFLNLIKNAITYNKKKGFVRVDARKEQNKVVITVRDSGIGISKEDLGRIFERFYRAGKVRDPEGKRTGLGLAIAKWITEIHRGTIHASSTLSKGSTFTVTLPLIKKA
ncbi:MAG: PAS domain S-box protein [Candidatus Pacebacteria bacterium]|nr:PAS domain S-box protein [Candidatus Paceibacterota bacterium]MDD5357339.1 PAS domain S-box protein [Candidatus Paceibacterota bacterium]